MDVSPFPSNQYPIIIVILCLKKNFGQKTENGKRKMNRVGWRGGAHLKKWSSLPHKWSNLISGPPSENPFFLGVNNHEFQWLINDYSLLLVGIIWTIRTISSVQQRPFLFHYFFMVSLLLLMVYLKDQPSDFSWSHDILVALMTMRGIKETRRPLKPPENHEI